MTKEGVNFFSVNLVCGAAPDIGCGSRSRPILVQLQSHPAIKEAWLNRPGTVIAVVWSDAGEPQADLAKRLISKHGRTAELLTGKDHRAQLKRFKTDTWYKGTDVNQLSIEEAGRIARQVVAPLLAGGLLDEASGTGMLADVEKYIEKELIELEDVSLLSQSSYYDQWAKEITQIARHYMPEDRIPRFELCDTPE